MKRVETATTRDLATWYGLTPVRVLQVLGAKGVVSAGRGPHGVKRWPRLAALEAMDNRATRRQPSCE